MTPILAAPAAPTHRPATDWRARAICSRHVDPDALFASAPEQRRQAAGCNPCPVRTECLAWALDNRFPFGVMGGMTERQRRALLRKRPGIKSWRALLEAARAEWEAAQDAEARSDVPDPIAVYHSAVQAARAELAAVRSGGAA